MRHETKRLLQMAGPLARGKALGIGFCGPIDRVLKTHLDLMMNVKMFLVPFNSDLLGGKSLEMSCSGIPWICSWTRRNYRFVAVTLRGNHIVKKPQTGILFQPEPRFPVCPSGLACMSIEGVRGQSRRLTACSLGPQPSCQAMPPQWKHGITWPLQALRLLCAQKL